MSNYTALRSTGIQFRPIDTWPGTETRSRRRATFSASLGSTMALLGRELRELNAKNVVALIAMHESDFRIDGIPYANARASHPGVVIAFDSRFGPLKFAVDTFTTWEDNLRAIALGMEALRKVDRYGVTKRGEQYTGWKALPSGSDDDHGIPDAEAAREYLDRTYGGSMKRALMETHPDRGGDREEFGKVMRIKGLLGEENRT